MDKKIEKYWKKIFEGTFFTSAWNFFKKILKKIPKKIDYYVGIFARKCLLHATPVNNNKVFFHTQEMRYTCNPKYISQELVRRRPDIEVVWRAPQKGRGGIPEDINIVPVNTYQYFKEIFSSKIIVANSFLYVGVPFSLKKKQILIQTWHGSLGIKRHDKHAMKDKPRKRALEKGGKMTSYCISNSSLETGSLRSTYWEDTPILEYGHARNDIFFDNHKEERLQVREKVFDILGLSPDTRVAMYAPTFRDSKDLSCYDIDYERLLASLEKKFGGKWCVLLKYHPSLRKFLKNMDVNVASENVIDVTEYDDMQELIAVTDVAITDYSSWIYDFVLMRKPGFIFATDIELYNGVDRGFYYPLEETPFFIARDNDDLERGILDFQEDEYLQKVENFLKDKGCVEDGHASERVVDLIEKLLDEASK